MMSCFAVRDRKAQLFNRPFFDINKVQAIRGFAGACKQPEAPFSQFPDDYELCYLGDFDEVKGTMQWLVHPEVLAEPRNFLDSANAHRSADAQKPRAVSQ